MSWCDLTILTARSNVTIQTVDQINPHTLLCHSLYLVHRLFLSLSFNISLSLSLFCLFSLSHFIVFNFLSLSQSLPLPKFLSLSVCLSFIVSFFLFLSLQIILFLSSICLCFNHFWLLSTFLKSHLSFWVIRFYLCLRYLSCIKSCFLSFSFCSRRRHWRLSLLKETSFQLKCVQNRRCKISTNCQGPNSVSFSFFLQ